MDKKPRKRRWLQFSVRTSLVLITLFAIWLGWWVDRMRRQQAAVETILATGQNYARFDYEVDSRAERPAVPTWLCDTFGDTYFRRAVDIEISGDLAVLKDLPYVRTLSLSGPQITDDDLVHLQSLKNLERLHLSRTYGVTDDGMRRLADLRSLRRLKLRNTKITDAGLRHLKGLENLELLQLDAGAYTAKGLRELKEAIPNLDIPNMDARPRAVTEEEAVAKLAEAGAQLMPNDLGEVVFVVLRGPQVTDETIAFLDSFKALERVGFLGTQVSFEALKTLRVLRPELEIAAPGVFEARPEEADAVTKLRRLGAFVSPDDQRFVTGINFRPFESPIDDVHLEPVARLSQLTRLEIDAGEISGAGLKHLATCVGLTSLRIGSSQVTDDDLRHLQKLTNLKSLHFTFAQINGSGLSYLADLDKLEHLDLSGNPLEDQYLKYLNGLPALRRINLDRTTVSDAGMKHLASCAGLEGIMLQYTRVTDQGVSLLLDLKKLKLVATEGSEVTDAMEERLPTNTMSIGLPRGRRPGNAQMKDRN